MKLESRDLPRLRWPLLSALLLIGVSCAIGWWSFDYTQRAASQRKTAASAFQRIDQQLRQVNNEEKELREKSAAFQRLQRRGFLGGEARLDWSEQLSALRQQWRLPVLDYEFAPQAPLESNVGGYNIVKSNMKLHLQLWHEEDLLRIFTSLHDEAKALVQLRSCKLNRLPVSPNNPAQLNADCEMDWITAQPISGK